MGEFFHIVLFPGGEETKCRTAVQNAAKDQSMDIQLDACYWYLYEKGPAVFMNEYCCGYDTLAEKLSADLSCPVMVLFIYDGDYWGYYLWENGTETDRFEAFPAYFDAETPPKKLGNASLLAQIFDVKREDIERYLIPWSKEGRGSYAYERDEAPIGDCWQMADFMDAIGFNWDLTNPYSEAEELI